MKNIIILFIVLSIFGCNSEENRKRIIEEHKRDSLEQVRKNDSIKLKITEDSILYTKFKKWIEPSSYEPSLHDTIYINNFFEHDINPTEYGSFDLKIKSNILSLMIEKRNDKRFEKGEFIYINIIRIDATFDMHFSDKELDIYDPINTYFKLTIIENDNKISTHIFKEYHSVNNQGHDEDLLKIISEHVNDKIQIEEFFAREETGHFEGEENPKDKKVRNFYLTESNKQALKESYMLFLLLNKK